MQIVIGCDFCDAHGCPVSWLNGGSSAKAQLILNIPIICVHICLGIALYVVIVLRKICIVCVLRVMCIS